jgi:4-diphosphocytidyl-2-C-methyl-D-erythritol kinase
MTIFCPAKINVFLDVTKKYKNNFHRIESVFFETNLADELIYNEIPSHECIIKGNSSINSEDNLIFKAYEAFFNNTKCKRIGIEVEFKKNIPQGGGLGGGSSDAAGMLKILNNICKTKLSSKKLKEIAAQIGSDVPYFIDGKTQIVSGTGSITRKINSKINFYSLMVFPEIKISTPSAYNWLDEDQVISTSFENEIKFKKLITAIENGNYDLFVHSLYNKFEKSIFSRFNELHFIKNEIIESGADNALMSGSGSTILGFFNSFEKMQKSVEILRKKGYKLSTIETQP